MTHKFKFFVSIAAVLALLCLFASCNSSDVDENSTDSSDIEESEASEPAHEHTAKSGWEFDSKNHFKLCDCGAQVEAGAHVFADSLGTVCEGCGVKIERYENGCDVTSFDEYGNDLIFRFYDTEGALVSEFKNEYTYDEKGNIKTQKEYSNGTLVGETEYALGEDSKNHKIKRTEYAEDETTIVIEYAVNASGEDFEKTITYNYKSGEKGVIENNDYGATVKTTYYSADGEIKTQTVFNIEYDKNGNTLSVKSYTDGVLSGEEKYKYTEKDGEKTTYKSQGITYNEDGGKSVVKYDERENLIEEKIYDKNGKVTNTISYDFKYDGDYLLNVKMYENGALSREISYEYDSQYNLKSEQRFDGGRLVMDIEYSLSEKGSVYVSQITAYDENGNEGVVKFDENGNQIK